MTGLDAFKKIQAGYYDLNNGVLICKKELEIIEKELKALEIIKETIFIDNCPNQRLFRIGVRVDGGIVYTPYIEYTRIGTGILADKSKKLKSLMEVLGK